MHAFSSPAFLPHLPPDKRRPHTPTLQKRMPHPLQLKMVLLLQALTHQVLVPMPSLTGPHTILTGPYAISHWSPHHPHWSPCHLSLVPTPSLTGPHTILTGPHTIPHWSPYPGHEQFTMSMFDDEMKRLKAELAKKLAS